MSPETFIQKETPVSCEELCGELAKNFEELISSLKHKNIPLSGRICTGITTREKQEMDLTIRGNKLPCSKSSTLSAQTEGLTRYSGLLPSSSRFGGFLASQNKKGNIHTMTFSVTEVLKDRGLKWIADLSWVVPVSKEKPFWRNHRQETRNWFDPHAMILLKTPRGAIKLSPQETPQIFPAKATDLLTEEPFGENIKMSDVFTLIIKTTEQIKSVVDSLDNQRKTVKDLSGRTLIVD